MSSKGRPLDQEWLQWLQTNVTRGCSKQELTAILLKEGFDDRAVREAFEKADASPPVQLSPPPRIAPKLAGAAKFDSKRIELYTADDFLSPSECAGLVALIQAQLRPSTISTPPSGEYDTAFRTSRTCDLSDENELVAKLDARICQALGMDASLSEPTQGQHYEVGQVFKAHTDFFKAYELEKYSTPTLGQRTWTFMVYLNEVGAGGQTRFVDADLTVSPQRGRAVLWNNLLASGAPNPQTRHESMPVTSGTKTIITKWFRMPLRRSTTAFSSSAVSWTQKL